MADNSSYGIQVFVDASGSTAGAREFARSAEDIANSAKKASGEAKHLKESLNDLGGKEVKEALHGIQEGLEFLNSGLKALGIGAVVVEFRELIAAGLELEDAMLHLQIASGAVGHDMHELEESTVKLSNAFGKSQIEVAAAQLEVAKSGFKNVSDNAKVTTAALDLAQVGFVDVGTATSTLTRIMQSYGVAADGAKSIQESLFIATKQGKIDIGELGALFNRLGPAVQASGISINEILTTLSALGQVGQNGYRSLVGVQEILRGISQTGPGAKQAFKDFSTSLEAAGVHATSLQDLISQKGLMGALQTLVQVAHGNQDVLGQVLGNPQAAITAINLVTKAAQAYADTTEEMTHKQEIAAEALKKVNESALNQAQTFRHQIQNDLQGLAGDAIRALGPVFTVLNQNFTAVEVVMTGVAAGLSVKLVPALIGVAARLWALATAGTAAAVGVTAVGEAEVAATVPTWGLATAVAALGGPITIITGLVAAAIAAFTLWRHHSQEALEEADKAAAAIDKAHPEFRHGTISRPGPTAATEVVKTVKQQAEQAAQEDVTTARGRGNTDNKTEADKNDTLVKSYETTIHAAQQLAEAQAALRLITDAHSNSAGRVTLMTSQQRMAYQQLQEEVFKLTDAHDQYNRKLAELEAKHDGVKRANLDFKNSMRDLNQAQALARGSAIEYAEAVDDLKLKHQQAQVSAEAKEKADRAVDDSTKALITTTATQANRVLELASALDHGKISQEEYNAAVHDSVAKLQKAEDATKALTSGELKYAQAKQASFEAENKAEAAGLQGSNRDKFLAESKVAQAEAERHTDALKDKVLALAGAYNPLLAIQRKYADQLAQINSLSEARPDLAPQLTNARELLPTQQKLETDKASNLPKDDKAAAVALDEYGLTMQRLSQDLASGTLNQTQFNQAGLEARQVYNAAQGQFNDYSKAVQEGGKAMNQALTGMLTSLGQRGTTLRSIFEGLAKSLLSSAAGILSHNLQEKAYSGLANSGNQAISTFGQNLASGAGVKLGASAGGTAALATAGTTLTAAGTGLVAAATALSGAAATLAGGAALGAAGGAGGLAKSFAGEAVSAAGSAGGMSGGGWFSLAAQAAMASAPTGGSFTAGDTALVGERGPEMVSFGQNAQVHPNDQIRAAVGAAAGNRSPTVVSSPNVTVPVQVVNVSDPNDIPIGMASPGGQKAITNYLSQNRSTVKSLLGG